MWAGFGVWWKLMQPLSKDYDVYALDIPGFGRSKAVDFRAIDYTSAVNYWVSCLEAWRIENKIDTFSMCAHSLGSIISAEYTIQYPDRVERLYMIAPIGMSKAIFRRSMGSNNKWKQKFLTSLFSLIKFMRLKRTHLPWLCGPYKRDFILDVLQKRSSWYGADSKEMREYLYNLCVTSGSGEDAFMAMVSWGNFGPQLNKVVDIAQLTQNTPW